MSIIKDYYKYSAVAQSAYSDLVAGQIDAAGIRALEKDSGMSFFQAGDFADTWIVLDQYNGMIEKSYTDVFGQVHYYLSPTGLSVTLFQNEETGEQVVAICGTQDINDWITDFIDIVILGTAEYQDQYQALSAKVEEWMNNGVLQPGFTVAGHSLGGFLGTNLTLEYYSDVAHTYI